MPSKACRCGTISGPTTHPRPCKHPSTTAIKSALQGIIRRPARQKNSQSNSKTPKMPRYPQKFTRRPAAMCQYNSLLCPQKSDNLSRSYVIYKEKCGQRRQKAAIQNSAVRWQNSLTPPAIAVKFLTPTGCLCSLFARIMQENGVFYAINPAKLRLFTPDLRRLHKLGITNAARP